MKLSKGATQESGVRRFARSGVRAAVVAVAALPAVLGPTAAFAHDDATYLAPFVQSTPPSLESRGALFADGAQPRGPVAEGDAKAEVIVLYGLNDNSGIDTRIGKIPALTKPPFSAYNSYTLLDRQEHPLKKGEWVSETLPDQNVLGVSLKDITTAQDPADTRYVVDANIKKPDGGEFFPNLEVSAKKGEYFFVGGPKYKEGVLVIGIRIE